MATEKDTATNVIAFPEAAIFRLQPACAVPHEPRRGSRERSLREIELAGDLLASLLPEGRVSSLFGVGSSRRAEAAATRSDGGFYKKRLMTMRQLRNELDELIEREEAEWNEVRKQRSDKARKA